MSTRTIRVRADEVTITATLKMRNLTTREVQRVRDDLADKLQDAASSLPYSIGLPRNRVRVY